MASVQIVSKSPGKSFSPGKKEGSMSRRDRFFAVIAQERDALKELGTKEIGLFGSVAREEDDDKSDYDILIGFEKDKKKFRNFIAIIDLLEEKLGADVELVTRESLSPHIGPRILREVMYAPL
jgi:hypothetical protein